MNIDDLRIWIVEDDPIIATDIKSLLKHHGFQMVGVCTRATRAFDMLNSLSPNFAILDIHLGAAISGIDIAEAIHRDHHFPYIFLTSFSDDDTMSAAQEQGPYGYLVKPFQGKTLISTIITAWNHFKRQQETSTVNTKNKLINLTTQEKLICDHLLQGLSYKQICEILFISQNTLKYHVKNIYGKMEVKSRSELSHLLLS